MRLIDQHVSITEQKERSKRSRYRIHDQFFRLWFHFVYGSSDRYEEFGAEAWECKFQQSPLDYDAFSKLESHVEELRWTPTGGGERTHEYALFSRSGFTPAVESAAEKRDDLRLFTVGEVVAALNS